MPLFRQYLEWSILNTGVILRDRPGGKKKWTGLNLKIEIAKQLLELSNLYENLKVGQCVESGLLECEISSDSGEDIALNLPTKIRLDCSICHVPAERSVRSNCCVHKQIKATRYYCLVCKKYLCLGLCWKLFHSKIKYLYDDSSCKSKTVRNTSKN